MLYMIPISLLNMSHIIIIIVIHYSHLAHEHELLRQCIIIIVIHDSHLAPEHKPNNNHNNHNCYTLFPFGPLNKSHREACIIIIGNFQSAFGNSKCFTT